MRYFFGTHNNYLEIDKNNRINKQAQNLLKKGYFFIDGRVITPEKKQLLLAGSNLTVDGVTITIDKTGWYCPSDLIDNDFFVHKGQLKKKITLDATKLLTKFEFDTPYKKEDGFPCYILSPSKWDEIKDIIFDVGIGAIKIGDTEYTNHNFCLNSYFAMRYIENFYRLYVFEIKDVNS